MGGWVYIITNKPHGVLYTGVTSDLTARIHQHRNGTGSKFAKRYNCTMLVYAEEHDRIEDAIGREKAIKEWPRLWKLRMIQEANPKWDELAAWDPGLRRDDENPAAWDPGRRRDDETPAAWDPRLRRDDETPAAWDPGLRRDDG